MSDDINTRLLERSATMIDATAGTLYAELIVADLGRNDLESLRVHVKQAEDWVYSENYSPDPNPLSDEDIENIASQAFSSKLEATDTF